MWLNAFANRIDPCQPAPSLKADMGRMKIVIATGRWLDPLLGQYSLRGLMIVNATGFIPFLLSPLSVISTVVMWEKQSVAWKEYSAEY